MSMGPSRSTEMERFCPVCGRGYAKDASKCEQDGADLALVAGEPDLIGTEIAGEYQIIDILGYGGMGAVYLARKKPKYFEVAVKILHRHYATDKDAIRRFLSEARAASRLSNPNTITIFDSGQTREGLLYIAMELLRGRPLSAVFAEQTRLPYRRAVRIVTHICESLAEAHGQGVIHRDLKPDNIFIERSPGKPETVKVLDFGIAKIWDDAGQGVTTTGVVCGTPMYMSPEQALSDPLDGRSDIYSLGILLYEALTGKPPFRGRSPIGTMVKQVREAPPPIPDRVIDEVPASLLTILDSMLAKEPDQRPESCSDLRKRLIECLGDGATSQPTPLPKSRKVAAKPELKQQETPTSTAPDEADKPQDDAGIDISVPKGSAMRVPRISPAIGMRLLSDKTPFDLVAANAKLAVLRCGRDERDTFKGEITFEATSEPFGPVEFRARVIGQSTPCGQQSVAIPAQWTRVTATWNRQFMATALRQALGIVAHVRDEGDLASDQVLIYQPGRQRIRLTPSKVSQRTTAAWAAPAPASRPVRERTQAGLPLAAPVVRARPKAHDTERVQQPTGQRIETLRKAPLFKVDRCDGTFGTMSGGRLPMRLENLGQSHCVFTIRDERAPEAGTGLFVGIPGRPVVSELVTVTGTVCEVELPDSTGRIRVTVELTRGPDAPREYNRVVQYWSLKSRAKPG